jgi:hypothetical protein
MAEAVERLEQTWQAFKADREIALVRAQGAVTAINQYGTAMASGKDWAQKPMAEAVERLEQTWQAFKADREIALVRAQGAVNAAIGHYGTGAEARIAKGRLIETTRLWRADPKIGPTLLYYCNLTNLLSRLDEAPPLAPRDPQDRTLPIS